MNKILKTLGLAALTFLAAGLYAPYASAANAQDAITAEADSTIMADYRAGGADIAKAINLAYVGSSTESVVTISATAMTFYAPANVLDTAVGTAGVITYSSTLGQNTLGALCDYLNGKTTTLTNYRCKLLDAKSSDSPGVMLKTQTGTSGTNDLKTAGGFSVLMTTNTVISLGINPTPGKRVRLRQCQVNGQSATTDNNLYVYGRLRKMSSGRDNINIQGAGALGAPVGAIADDTYLVWKSSTTQNVTSTVPPLTGHIDGFLEFAQDAHVVVRAGLPTGVSVAAQTANNFIQCFWEEK